MHSDAEEVAALPDKMDYIKPKCNDEYIGKIRKNLEENAAARAEREKRRRKVLVDQLKAHEAQEVRKFLVVYFAVHVLLHCFKFKIYK